MGMSQYFFICLLKVIDLMIETECIYPFIGTYQLFESKVDTLFWVESFFVLYTAIVNNFYILRGSEMI